MPPLTCLLGGTGNMEARHDMNMFQSVMYSLGNDPLIIVLYYYINNIYMHDSE